MRGGEAEGSCERLRATAAAEEEAGVEAAAEETSVDGGREDQRRAATHRECGTNRWGLRVLG
jgi:hypothetical protein